jgi:hypothetical protein
VVAGGEPRRVAVAIETPRGAIVETLLEQGFQVCAINPKQLARFRDRHTMAGAKDDWRDAFVLADSLRTDPHSFRPVHVSAPELLMLRELIDGPQLRLEGVFVSKEALFHHGSGGVKS